MSDDRLTTAPQPASVCSNCGAYMLPPRCAACGWVLPVDDEDDPPLEPTDLFDDEASGEQE